MKKIRLFVDFHHSEIHVMKPLLFTSGEGAHRCHETLQEMLDGKNRYKSNLDWKRKLPVLLAGLDFVHPAASSAPVVLSV